MKTGARLYRCEECGEKSYHHWIERNRAARMRCPGCGSARLEMCSRKAQDEAAKAQQVRLEGHRDMTRPPADFDPTRKVT